MSKSHESKNEPNVQKRSLEQDNSNCDSNEQLSKRQKREKIIIEANKMYSEFIQRKLYKMLANPNRNNSKLQISIEPISFALYTSLLHDILKSKSICFNLKKDTISVRKELYN